MGDEVFDVESAASSLVGPDDSDDEAVVVAVVEDQAGSNEVDRAVDFAYVIKSTPSRRTRLNMPSVKPRCGGRMHTNGLLETCIRHLRGGNAVLQGGVCLRMRSFGISVLDSRASRKSPS